MNGYTDFYNLIKSGVSTEASYQRLLGNNPDGTRNPAYPIYLDADNLVDFMLDIIFTANLDSAISYYAHASRNWYGIWPRDGRAGFRFFVHDAELTLLDVNANRTSPPYDIGDASVLVSSPEWMYHELLANPTFRLRAADRIQKHFFNDGALTPDANKARFLAREAEIDQAIIAESARWGDARRATPFTRNVEWLSLINQLAVNPGCYFDLRTSIVLAQLTAAGVYPSLTAPSFSQFGGSVPDGYLLTITAPAGLVYYTLDGSDPRALGGGVSPAANLYTGPVPLSQNGLVRARVLNGATWSALTEAAFEVARSYDTLLITEIMYHPLPGLDPNGQAVDGEEFEFLELKNTGTVPLDLGGLSFTAGISFTFTNGTWLEPGQFFVLVRNPVWFAARYPGVAANGVYAGRLSNGGETVALGSLLDPAFLSVNYGVTAPWPVAPDGFGFSLVPVHPNANPDPDAGRSWRASALLNGSPGADDPTPTIPPVVVNEGLTASLPPAGDAIELFNPTAARADLEGWFLTDDPTQPMKYRIPAGSSIEAGGFLVFDETDFNPSPGTNNSFALSSTGEAVYLFSGDAATNLTGYSHGFSFGAAAPGVTFGRYVLSTGEEDFPAQIVPTLDGTNAGPLVGPVVLNEIHYHPAAGGDPFLELKNIATTNVALFDPLRPTNTWQLQGIGYSFPSNLTLLPGQLLLVVATNPATFRTRYSVPAEITILGPWPGTLQENGERLELQQPGLPDTNGVVPYITVDAVRYNDKPPWPTAADGRGPSLQRLSDGAYGNDPASWIAALPSPGRLLAPGTAPVITVQPTNVNVSAQGDAAFQVVADGAPTLHYQWSFNGSPIADATGATLFLTNVQTDQAGLYTVAVFNESGSAESQPARLTVRVVATIVTQPKDVTVRIRPDPQAAATTNATFTVLASSPTPLTYQWRFNGTDLPGRTTPTLTITNVQIAHAGAYDVAVTSAEGTVVSATAHLYPLVSPVFVQSPLSQSVVAGGTVTLSAAFIGYPGPFTNEWRLSSTLMATHVLSDSPDFFTFTVPNMVTTLQYRAFVRGPASTGGGTLSSVASISVLADADADGLPDVWESAYGITDRNADADGDGALNWQEYQAGTNPTNALSILRLEIAPAADLLALRFGAVSNLTYTVQHQDVLGSNAWSRLTDVVARSTNRVETLTTTNPVNSRFYRVVTPRQP